MLQDQHSRTSPYNQLYIYYLQGKVGPKAKEFGEYFIGNWEEGDTSFLFFSRPATGQIERLLAAQPQLNFKDEFCMSYDDWHGEKFSQRKAGRFMLIPAWDNTPTDNETIPIIIDPGVVFGVGNHPTTQDCLECIDHIISTYQIKSTLDMGTGTGVLAIAAARLGCPNNYAVDNNFLAAKTALKNVNINKLNNQIHVVCARAENFMDHTTDLLIANIHYDIMKQLICDPGFLKNKYIVLSGLLRSEMKHVETMLKECKVKIIKKLETEGIWNTICGSIR